MLRQRTSSVVEGLPPPDPSTSVLEFQGVTVTLENTQVLGGIDLRIPGSGITVVMGASGSGKSTLTRLCNRLLDPLDGVVMFRGKDVRHLDVLELRRAVGMVFQRPTLFAGSVRDNLAATGISDIAAHLEILAAVDLEAAFLDRTASTLSGGESQRVCLARTLLMRPQVLIADEATASLDATSAATLEGLATDLAARGVPVLWVTHDVGQFERIADHGVVLDRGRIVTSQPAAALRSDPAWLAPFVSRAPS